MDGGPGCLERETVREECAQVMIIRIALLSLGFYGVSQQIKQPNNQSNIFFIFFLPLCPAYVLALNRDLLDESPGITMDLPWMIAEYCNHFYRIVLCRVVMALDLALNRMTLL